MKNPSSLALVALLVASLISTGCSRCNSNSSSESSASAAAPRAQRGGTLVVGLKAAPDSANVYFAKTDSSLVLANRLLPRLAREIAPESGHEARFDPELATSWSWSDEGKTLTFTLAPTGTWTDRQPVTCRDVQFTWQAQVDPQLAWRLASLKRHIVQVECPGPLTAVYRFDVAYPTQLMDANDINILPASLSAIPFDQWRQVDWATRLPTAGPFRLERFAPDQEIVLARHDGSSLAPDRPYLDRIVLRPIPDSNARLQAFLAGDLHVAEDLQPGDLAQVAQRPELRVERRSGWRYTYLGWNTIDPTAYADYRRALDSRCAGKESCPEDPAALVSLAASKPHRWFSDARVRRALNQAIDRQGLIDTLLLGEASIPPTPILSPLVEHDGALAPLPFDRDAARTLLREAGIADSDKDGTLDRNSEPFQFTLYVQAGNALRRQAAELIQRDLGQIGVAVTITPIENSAFYATLARREMDAWIGGWSGSMRVDMTEVLHQLAAVRDGNNYGTWIHAEADELALRARDTIDNAARAKLWHQWERIFLDQAPYVILMRPRTLVGTKRELHGTESLLSSDLLHGVESWWIGTP